MEHYVVCDPGTVSLRICPSGLPGLERDVPVTPYKSRLKLDKKAKVVKKQPPADSRKKHPRKDNFKDKIRIDDTGKSCNILNTHA